MLLFAFHLNSICSRFSLNIFVCTSLILVSCSFCYVFTLHRTINSQKSSEGTMFVRVSYCVVIASASGFSYYLIYPNIYSFFFLFIFGCRRRGFFPFHLSVLCPFTRQFHFRNQTLSRNSTWIWRHNIIVCMYLALFACSRFCWHRQSLFYGCYMATWTFFLAREILLLYMTIRNACTNQSAKVY